VQFQPQAQSLCSASLASPAVAVATKTGLTLHLGADTCPKHA
jgi:hypothetical protein